MAKSKKGNMIGSWAFLIGVVLAAILGLGFAGGFDATISWVLVVIGLIVGLLNIADKEAQPFLLSGVVLIIASSMGQGIGIAMLDSILSALLLVFVPATIIVALKNVFGLARR
jgi:hypothetical protein